MNLKQQVDKYLLENYETINVAKETPTFRWKEVADKIGKSIGSEYCRSRWRKITGNKTVTIPPTVSPEKFSYTSGKEDKNSGTKEFTFTADNIPSDQEIIDHFKIDTIKYRINQIYHKTSFGGKYAITVSLLSNKPEFAVDYKKEFQDFLDSYNLKKLSPSVTQKQTDSKNTKTSVLLNLSDLHVGKLAWDKETGSDYDVDLAKQVFLEALNNLANQSIRCFNVEEFVLNIGGDFLHTNGSNNSTANGTIMNDVDSRYQKIFTKGLEILTTAIDFLSSFEDVKVKVFIVQGNHDLATSFYLGESLKAFYRKDKNVEILNDPHIRKYHKYGVSTYMLTHGDCKDDGLPLTFATEKPDYFANSIYRYIFLGHLHKSSRKVYLTENEVNGVVSRRLNSLSPTDAWHNANNYVGAKRMANALVFDKQNGQIAEFNYIVKK
jgi:hypothetical protein